MPTPIDAAASAKNPIIITAATGALQLFSADVLGVEPAIVAPSAGYKAYNKRVAFARLAVHNPEQFGYAAATYIERVTNGSIAEAQNTNVSLAAYMNSQNPMGKPILNADATVQASINDVGATSGRSIFDILAGVSQSDLI